VKSPVMGLLFIIVVIKLSSSSVFFSLTDLSESIEALEQEGGQFKKITTGHG
jgi:hypothetical protein